MVRVGDGVMLLDVFANMPSTVDGEHLRNESAGEQEQIVYANEHGFELVECLHQSEHGQQRGGFESGILEEGGSTFDRESLGYSVGRNFQSDH